MVGIADYALILANDLQTEEEVLALIAQTIPHLDGVKIGITSTMTEGLQVVRSARTLVGDKPLFVDYKVADIGHQNPSGDWQGTNAKIVGKLAEAGATHITVHGILGFASLEEGVNAAREKGAEVLTLPYMTHKGAGMFFQLPLRYEQREHIKDTAIAYGLNPSKPENTTFYQGLENARTVSDVILLMGERFDVGGYIGPANNLAVLRSYRDFTEKRIWCPGFGRQGAGDLETQIRTWAPLVGPNSAMIVGSEIYKAQDPARAAREIRALRDKVVHS